MNSIRLGLALDGEWSLAQDPADVGIQEQWFAKPPPADAMPVTVPGVWDLWLPDYDGAGWYFRTFEVTTDWLAGTTTLGSAAGSDSDMRNTRERGASLKPSR